MEELQKNTENTLVKKEHMQVVKVIVKTGKKVGEAFGQVISDGIDYIVDKIFKK